MYHHLSRTRILLRASEFSLQPGIPAMCALCGITRPSEQVTLFSAPRAGEAGRDGNTIGTYPCDDLACSHLVRVLPPATTPQTPGELPQQRIEGLLLWMWSFTANVMKTA